MIYNDSIKCLDHAANIISALSKAVLRINYPFQTDFESVAYCLPTTARRSKLNDWATQSQKRFI